MKDNKLKVGRPKLADKELKKKSIFYIVGSIVAILVLIGGYAISISTNNYTKLTGRVLTGNGGSGSTCTNYNDSSSMLVIGDSRMYGLCYYVGKASYVSIVSGSYINNTYRIDSTERMNTIKNYISKITKKHGIARVFVVATVNDYSSGNPTTAINAQISTMKKIRTYAKNNNISDKVKIYGCSLIPEKGKSSKKYNETLQSKLKSTSYTYLSIKPSTVNYASDGVHFQSSTSKDIYNIMNKKTANASSKVTTTKVKTTKTTAKNTTKSTTKANTTTKNNTTTKANTAKECKIIYIGSGKGSNILKYKVKCVGGATISDTKYQVAGESMISRDSDKRKVKVGKIIFRDSRKGKNIKLRVYYNNNQSYDEKIIELGSGKKTTESSSKSGTKTTKTAATTTKNVTTTKEYSKNPATTNTVTSSVIETYSVVNIGAEPNACYIRILANNGKTIKYQVICQANGRPLSVKLVDGSEETYILKDFRNHKGYIGTHTYTVKKTPSQKALLRLTYKKTLRNADETDTKYIASRSIYENGTYKVDGNEVAKINTNKIPTDKCTISVSNVRTNRFKWTVKCDQGARPLSVRLTEVYNGREGSQIKGLPHGYDSKYGITKSEVSKSYVSKGSDYTLVLYFGTKQKDYYRTTVSFTTPMTNPTTTTTVATKK